MGKTYQGRTLAGIAVEVAVDGSVIRSVRPLPGDGPLPLLAPLLVDLQQNGALGHMFNELHRDPGGLDRVAAHVRRHGVGRMLATFTTYPYELLLESLAVLHRRLASDRDLERLYFGAFFEGIYMSPEDGWRGIHPPEHMRDPNWDEWARLQDAAGGRIRIFNVAPERPHAIETIRQAVARGLRVSMGHCHPDADTIRRAVDAGADLVTHLGNGAPLLVHRHRNPFWTWMAEPRISVGLIADGFHLPADVLRAVFAAKGRDRVFLVSDSSGYAGMPPGDYEDFTIEPGGHCHVTGSELLAGAWFQADRCVERMCELGWSLADAWRQQSVIPARLIGLPLPELAAGQPAEFALATWTAAEGLRLEQVVDHGREVLGQPVTPRSI